MDVLPPAPVNRGVNQKPQALPPKRPHTPVLLGEARHVRVVVEHGDDHDGRGRARVLLHLNPEAAQRPRDQRLQHTPGISGAAGVAHGDDAHGAQHGREGCKAEGRGKSAHVSQPGP
jgi:hypothetical protein